jgi:hypothetical protein
MTLEQENAILKQQLRAYAGIIRRSSPYLTDMESDNAHDPSVGMYKDLELTRVAKEAESFKDSELPKSENWEERYCVVNELLQELKQQLEAKDSEISRLKETLHDKQAEAAEYRSWLEDSGELFESKDYLAMAEDIRGVLDKYRNPGGPKSRFPFLDRCRTLEKEIAELKAQLEAKQEARRLDRKQYANWIKGVFDDRTDDWDIESLVHRLAFEFDAHVSAVYDGADQWEQEVKELRAQLEGATISSRNIIDQNCALIDERDRERAAGKKEADAAVATIQELKAEIELLRKNGASLRPDPEYLPDGKKVGPAGKVLLRCLEHLYNGFNIAMLGEHEGRLRKFIMGLQAGLQVVDRDHAGRTKSQQSAAATATIEQLEAEIELLRKKYSHK